MSALERTVITQMGMKKGIKTFVQAGVDAVQKQPKHIHNSEAMKPMHSHEMSSEQSRALLQYLIFLKKNRDGKIKGRGCADKQKQCKTTSKDDAIAPTVAIESVMLLCTMNAKECQEVATVNISGAFMQADMDETVHVRLEGAMA